MKAVVRNTESLKPRTTFINHYGLKQQDGREEKENAAEKPSNSEANTKIRFKLPEPNSSLVIARKIERLEKMEPRKVKSVSSLHTEKLIADDKVLQHFCSCIKLCKRLTFIF